MKRHFILICLMLIPLSACFRAPRPEIRTESPRELKSGGWVPIEQGMASWYGRKFHGRLTANGERYDMYGISAAHKTLPLGTWVMVRNESNGKTLKVRINDRGPFVHGRIIDLSYGAARKLDMVDQGVVPVTLYAQRKPRAACYAAQVGAFSVRDNARNFADDIRRRFDVPTTIVYRMGLYKVLVGRFSSEQDAQAEGRKLDMDFFVVSCD